MAKSHGEFRLRLDRRLLEEAGLGALSPIEQNLFLRYCYDVLEFRVGVVLARQMRPSQLDEFERLIDADLEFAEAILDYFIEGWRRSTAFEERLGNAMRNERIGIREALAQEAAFVWLEDALPHYREVVRKEFDRLKEDISTSADEIVGRAG